MDFVKAFTEEQLKKDVPQFDIGNDVKVYCRIVEGERTRTQIYEGTVIAKSCGGISEGMSTIFCVQSASLAKPTSSSSFP